MKGAAKLGIVLAGYVAAAVAAGAVVAIRSAGPPSAAAQASAGMAAFGDSVLGVAVFGAVATVPTALALYFVRGGARFWAALSAAAIAVAATAVLAAAIYFLAASTVSSPRSTWTLWASIAVLRMLATPLCACVDLLAALFSPVPRARQGLLVAAAAESAVAAITAVHWMSSRHGG